MAFAGTGDWATAAFAYQTVSGSVIVVSGGYFPLPGVKPLYGRTITAEDDRPDGGNPVAVLDYGYWRDKLGSDQPGNPQQCAGIHHRATYAAVPARQLVERLEGVHLGANRLARRAALASSAKYPGN